VVLDPDHRRLLAPGLADQGVDVGDHGVTVVSALNDAVLDVDDDEGGVGSVLERGHGDTANWISMGNGASDGTRTRDLRRDRPAL
jgi:hypothetical protein